MQSRNTLAMQVIPVTCNYVAMQVVQFTCNYLGSPYFRSQCTSKTGFDPWGRKGRPDSFLAALSEKEFMF